jgi:hypothetical protein
MYGSVALERSNTGDNSVVLRSTSLSSEPSKMPPAPVNQQ